MGEEVRREARGGDLDLDLDVERDEDEEEGVVCGF